MNKRVSGWSDIKQLWHLWMCPAGSPICGFLVAVSTTVTALVPFSSWATSAILQDWIDPSPPPGSRPELMDQVV